MLFHLLKTIHFICRCCQPVQRHPPTAVLLDMRGGTLQGLQGTSFFFITLWLPISQISFLSCGSRVLEKLSLPPGHAGTQQKAAGNLGQHAGMLHGPPSGPFTTHGW